MKEKKVNMYEYAQRVSEFSPKKSEVHEIKSKISGMKLRTMEFSFGKKQDSKSLSVPFKNAKKMNMEDFDSKRVSFVRSAYVAYKCCQNQDLHLFQIKKIYLEKKFNLKGVVGWKLPKRRVVNERLKSLVEGMKAHENKNHLITWIVNIQKSDEEKNLQAQLELQKQGKEKRNYIINKPLF